MRELQVEHSSNLYSRQTVKGILISDKDNLTSTLISDDKLISTLISKKDKTNLKVTNRQVTECHQVTERLNNTTE